MQILHIYKDYYPVLGGIENHVKLLAEGQAAAGHDVTVLVTSRSARTQEEMRNGVTVIKCARLVQAASTPMSLVMPWWVARQRPDITHLHFPYPPGELSQWPHLSRRPTVLSYHSDIVRQKRLAALYGPAMRLILRRVDRILVGSPNYLASSVVLRQVQQRCTVVPYGIRQKPFQEVAPIDVESVSRRHGPGPWVLFVGVLRYYKGLEYLVEAMNQVHGRLLIVGDGPEREALRALALRLGDRVVFAGAIPDSELPAYYGAASVFCLPASERSEAFGLVQVEALASSLPIISTELGTGTSYVNEDGVSGVVVPPRDPAALVAALNRVLDDPALRARLANGALARARAFTAERMLSDVEGVYARVLKERARRGERTAEP
ncbi:MAG: glycosyltransferase [Chloroflexi bacterium]|nr:glycosyltransferase [Chloroflexota bacterium]